MADAEAGGEPQIRIVWEEQEDAPVLFANQMLMQHQPDEFLLTFGQLVPPPLIGSEEERRHQLSQLTYVPIRVIGRFGFTRRRLEEFIRVLQENLERHDEAMRRLGEESTE